MSEAHTACMASTLTEVKIKYVFSDNSAMLRCLFWGGGETPRFLRAFPFAIKACLSWEIQDRILLRERWKDRPSGVSVGRAREGSGRSIERSSNQSVTGVNLELGKKKEDNESNAVWRNLPTWSWCNYRCQSHGSQVWWCSKRQDGVCWRGFSAPTCGFFRATCLSEMTFL